MSSNILYCRNLTNCKGSCHSHSMMTCKDELTYIIILLYIKCHQKVPVFCRPNHSNSSKCSQLPHSSRCSKQTCATFTFLHVRHARISAVVFTFFCCKRLITLVISSQITSHFLSILLLKCATNCSGSHCTNYRLVAG